MASFDHELAHCAPFQPLVVAVGGPELSVCLLLPSDFSALLGALKGHTGDHWQTEVGGRWEQSALQGGAFSH